MSTTPLRGGPYPPAVGVAPDVPYWLQQLAEWAEAQLVAAGRIESGVVSPVVAGLTSGAAGSVAVTFATPFPTAPRVVASLNGVSGGSSTLVARAGSITTTGCTVFVYNVGTATVGAISPQAVSWVAHLGGI